MTTPPSLSALPVKIAAGDLFAGKRGGLRVMAVAEDCAMVRYPGCPPFAVLERDLRAGEYGEHKSYTAPESAPRPDVSLGELPTDAKQAIAYLRDQLGRLGYEAFDQGNDALGILEAYVNAHRALGVHIGTLQSALRAQSPAEGGFVSELGERIRTQDNRITSHPIFAVQQKRVIYGIDLRWDGDPIWVFDGSEETDPDEIARLEAYYEEHGDEPDGYTRTGKVETWEFVTACFTEQGCKDYLARDGHNLKEPRIYAYSAYRNAEWIKLRELFAALSQPGAGAE